MGSILRTFKRWRWLAGLLASALLLSACNWEVPALPGNGAEQPEPGPFPKQLNDTGIDWCADANNDELPCPVPGFSGQDGEFGRDAAARDDQLDKVGTGAAGFDFTKLDSGGRPLWDQTQVWAPGGNAMDGNRWACVRDSTTDLVWEVKVDDASDLQHAGHFYRWYNPDPATNGGFSSNPAEETLCAGVRCDTDAYIAAVNARALCGVSTWRLPTVAELQGVAHLGAVQPAIDVAVFPNTASSGYWTVTPRDLRFTALGTGDFRVATVDFRSGEVIFVAPSTPRRVRLVHSD